MKDIAIYGAGGLGREVASLINFLFPEDDPRNLIGFFDDGKSKGEKVGHFGEILGGITELNSWDSPLEIALCFGNGATTQLIFSKITNPLVTFPNLINRTFFVSDKESFQIGQGNIIHGGSIVTTNISLGDFNLLNGGVVFGHDVKIGSFNTFMPACRISGEVTIGDCCLFGAMSFVKQGLNIGNNVRLSPLSPLLTTPKDNSLYIGNPAKKFNY